MTWGNSAYSAIVQAPNRDVFMVQERDRKRNDRRSLVGRGFGMKDYYTILGVAPDVSASNLKRAYRKKAMDCHPDRGGSHEAMVSVVEAWEALSHSDSRKRYDDARAHADSDKLQRAAKQDAEAAAKKAETYERDWESFKSSYWGSADSGVLRIRWPTASSFLGKAVIVIGAILGLGLGLWTAISINQAFDWMEYRAGAWGLIIIIFLLCTGGAWVAQLLHSNIVAIRFKTSCATGNPQDDNDIHKIIVRCSACKRRLRLPCREHDLDVTCPSCKHSFTLIGGDRGHGER